MEAAVSQVTTAFSKPEDESTWTAMDKSLAFFTVSIQKVSPLVGVEALKRITKHITQSLLSPRSALQKTAITLLSTSASSLGPSFASQGMATEHLTSLLQLSAKASAVMVRLAWSGIASIVSDVGGTGMYPFAVLCCSELRKGSKASKPLRIICVDSVCCILEALRSNLVDGGRFIEVVQEVLRLAISDSANEVRDAGRRLFGEYSQLYSNQVDKFTSSLTPQHMKSLQIKPPPTVKPASNNSRDNNQETNSAKQLVREKQEQEVQQSRYHELALPTSSLVTKCVQPHRHDFSSTPQNLQQPPISPIQNSRIRALKSKESIFRFVTHRDSIDDHMQFDSFGAESLLDGETPPIFLDDAEADEDEFGDAVVPGSSWTAGFGAMADSIPFWSESHHDSDRDIALEDDSSKEQGLDSFIVSGHDAVVSIVADIEENVADLVEAVENAVETMVEASEEEIVRMIAELSASEDVDPVTVPIVAAAIAEQEFGDVREQLKDSVRDGSLSTESVQAEEGIDSPAQPATEPLILADDAESVVPPHASSLKTQVTALLLTSRPSTPSTAITAVSADEISHDLITTLNVTYTMTLEEEVAAAEEAHRLANGLPFVNIQSADEVDNPSEEAELDPEFLWDNGGPREEEESVDGDEDGPAGGDGNISFVEVLTAPLPTTTSTDHPLAAVEPICLLNSLVSESEDIVDGGNNNTDKDEDAGKSGALDETNDPERDPERTPISPIPSLNGSAVETVASVRDSGYIASVTEEEIFVETQRAISEEQHELLEFQRVDSDGDAETVGDEDDADTVVSEDDHCNDDSFPNESDDPGNPLILNLDIATTNSIVEGAPDDHADLQIGETSPEICHLESCKDTVELSAVSVDGALDTMIVRVEVADSTVDDLERLSGLTDPSVLDGQTVSITKHSDEILTTEAPFQASSPSAASFDDSVPIFELSVENLIAEAPAQASTSSSSVENSVEIKSSGVDQESDTSLRIVTNLVPENSNPSSTRVRTSFLPMARVKSLTGTTSTSKSIQTPLQTVRRQQTLSSLPQQQPRPPTPSQPPPAMARTSSQQRQTTIPRPLSFSGSPSAVPQSPSTSHTHPFLRKGRTTPTPPLQQTLLRKPTPPMPTPSPRTTPSPSSSIGSAPSTPPPSPHSPHLVARQPTKTAIAYKPVLKGTLTKSSSTVQLTTAERSGSKLVPTSARRASQVVRSNSDPSVPVAPFLSALNRRVEQPGGSVALRRTISTTMVAPSPPARSSTPQQLMAGKRSLAGVLAPTVSSSLKQEAVRNASASSSSGASKLARPTVSTTYSSTSSASSFSSPPHSRVISPKAPSSPILASMIPHSTTSNVTTERRPTPTPPMIRTNSNSKSNSIKTTPRTTPVSTPTHDQTPLEPVAPPPPQQHTGHRKQVSWNPDLAVILGTSDNENWTMQLENQVSDAIMWGGVDSVWELLEAYGGHDAVQSLEPVVSRLEDLVGAVVKDLETADSKKKTSGFIKKGLAIYRSVLEIPGIDTGALLPTAVVTGMLQSVLKLAAKAEGTDDSLEIEYEVANALETVESHIRFGMLSTVISNVLSQIKATSALTSGSSTEETIDTGAMNWVSSQRTCYEMLARTLEGVISGNSINEGDSAINVTLDADWESLTVHVVEGLESKHPLTRKAAFDCAVALCKCRQSTQELYDKVLEHSGKSRQIVLKGMMERRLR